MAGQAGQGRVNVPSPTKEGVVTWRHWIWHGTLFAECRSPWVVSWYERHGVYERRAGGCEGHDVHEHAMCW